MAMIYKGEIQRLFPILEAVKEDKTIQYKDNGVWRDIDGDDEGFCLGTLIEETDSYRIKPKYRPFKDAEECLKEMSTHTPFGWLKEIKRDIWTQISYVHNEGIETVNSGSASYKSLFDCFTFFDGKPFGVKVEE